MKKRLLNLFLALVMVAFVVPTWADAATTCWHDSRSKWCTVEKVEAKAATCTEDGNTEYYYCTFCKENMKLGSDGVYTERVATDGDIVIPAGHKYVGGVCTECKDCENGHLNKRRIITAGAATCAEDGAVEHVNQCKACGLYFCGDETNYTGIFPDNVRPATGEHNYTEKVSTISAATCTERQKNLYKCEDCDATEEREVGHALDHNWDKGTVTQAATCTEDGVKTFTCSRCGETKTETIKAKHTFKTKNAVDATCVTDGWKGGKACSVCGEPENANNVIPATGDHVFSVFQTNVNLPTCTEARHDRYKCVNCDATEVREHPTEKALEHDWNNGKVTQKATCTEDGEKTFTCSRCGETKTETIKAKHTFRTKNAVDATCVTDGWKGGKACSVCGEPEDANNVIPATGVHVYTVFETNVNLPTCTEARHDRYKCVNCDATEVREHPTEKALDHAWDEGTVTQAATCQEEGVKEYACTRTGCDATKTEPIAKLTCYIETIDEIPATCNNPGKTAGTQCRSCGNGYYCAYCATICEEPTEVPKLGHDLELVETIKAATCEEAGEGKYQCTRCVYHPTKVIKALGHSEVEEVLVDSSCTRNGALEITCENGCGLYRLERIDAKGHTEEIMPAVDASCTATGLTEGKKCSVCNETLVAQVVTDKLPHAWEDVEAKAATCQEDGYNAHRACANCDETDGKTVIPANNTGHNYVNNKCTICGEYDPAHEHQGTGTVTTDSTCTTKGVKSFSCSGCDYTWTEDIAKKAHSYGADDRCTVCQKLNSKHEHSYAQTDYREPTCDIGGQVTQECSVCGDTTQTTINALGHSYSNGRCIRCGTAAACTHSTTNTTVIREATCKRAGEKVTTCTGCGKVMGTESIPATGNHNYVNDYCTGCGQVDPYKKTADNQDVYPLG